MFFFKDSYFILKKIFILGLIILPYSLHSFAQFGPCDTSVPIYSLDLTGSPDSIWTMPNVMRDGSCCGYNHPPNSCVKFIVTLDPASQGITFNVTEGAIPGNLEWQLMNSDQDACDPTTYPAGVPVCLNGIGPHIIVFCKPGGNNNTYTISSIQAPSISGDLILNDGCSGSIQATGFDVSTLQYNSVYPGITGAYNNILSCTSGCSVVNITGQQGYPPYVDFQVCGMPIGACFASLICDTVRVYFNPTLTVTINPLNPIICYGANTTSVTAFGAGGFPPYTYQWSTGDTSQTISIGVGTYSVTIYDGTNCPAGTGFINVTYFTSPVSVNAGPDQIVCTNNFPVNLSGTVSGASGVIWFGGSGTIFPSPASLNIIYTPSASDTANGEFSLNIVTTGNGNCPADTDTVHVSIFVFQATITDSSDISCYGAADGSTEVTANSGSPPLNYLWSNGSVNAINNSLSGGNYIVTVTDNVGCFDILSVSLYEPPLITATTNTTTTACQDSSGTAEVFPAGGVPGYSYLWSDPDMQTTQVADSLGAGYYSVTVTDLSNCSMVFGVAVNNDGPPYVAISDSVMVSCFGGSNGSATSVITTAGVPPHTFLWNDPLNQTTATVTGLVAGIYIVIVTDSINCVGSAQVTISQPPPIVSDILSQNISCFGQADGSAFVTANGGTPPYSFLWSNGQGVASVSGLGQGLHYVTITDFNNCQYSDSVFIYEPLSIAATVGNLQNVTCNGLSNGSITIIGSNGTQPYTFSWASGQSASSISNLAPDVYIVTVTDDNGCEAVSNITISQPAVLNISGTALNVPCYGNTTGNVDITVTGGTSPYLYGWSNGSITEDLYFIGAGNYSATINDANGCSSSQSFSVTQPNAITIYSEVNHISCFGADDGSINIFTSGGTPLYNYLWNNGSTNNNITNLLQGTYQLTVTDTNLCTATIIKVINEPPVFSAVITLPLTYNGYGVPCFGDTTGFINLSATGGVTPYTYSWSNNTNNIDLYNVSAGNYSVTVTDAHNCTVIVDTVLTQPQQFIVSINLTDVLCFSDTNGSANVTISGGVPGYSVIWSTTATSEDLLNIPAGSYWVQVKDSNNCTFFDSLLISQPNELILSCTPDTIICKNTQAIINAFCTGGVLPYNFYWNNNPGLSVFTITTPSDTVMNVYVQDNNNCISNNVVSSVFTYPDVNLTVATTDDSVCIGSSVQIIATISGGYSNNYTLYDMNQTITSPYTITPNVTQEWIFMAKDSCNVKAYDTITIYALPVPLISSISVTDVLCYGQSTGSINITVNGGTPGYSFLWNPLANTEDLVNVPAGSYYVQIIDTNNCFVTDSMNITQPTELIISCSDDTLICKNSQAFINADATGGIPPFTFYWNGLPGIDNLTVFPQADTTFILYVKDANNCVSDSVYSSINTVPSVQLSITLSNDSVCIGNSTQLTASINGSYTGPYTLYYNNQIILSPYIVTPVTTHDWIFMAEDTCNIQSYDTVTIQVLPVPEISNTSITDLICYGNQTGAIDLSVSGGSPGYSFLWNTTALTEDLNNISAGTYQVQITDIYSCFIIDTFVVTEPPEIIVISPVDTLICKNITVNITASVTGGISPYTFYWNGAPGVNDYTITPNTDTMLQIYVTDASNCNSDTVITTINVVPSVILSISATNDSICIGNSTQIIANTYGAYNGAYTLYYNNQVISNPYDISPNSTHDWIFTAKDTCNIQAYDTVTIYALPNPMITDINTTDVLCFGNSTGSINITVTGGTPGYQYLWSTVSTTEDLTNVPAGIYFIQVRDTNNCLITDTMSINEPEVLQISSSFDTLTCKNSNTILQAEATGGTSPYTYFWNGNMGISQHTIVPVSDTTIYVYVKDVNNCITDSVSTNISIYPNVSIDVFTVKDTVCSGTFSQIFATASGGAGPPYYLFNENMQPIINPYTITPINSQYWIITGMDSCYTTAVDSVFIQTISVPTISISADVYSGCIPLLVKFNATSDPEPQGYIWNFGENSAFSFVKDPEYLYSEEGIYDVSLNVTTIEGCSSNLLLTDLITVFPKPESIFNYDPVSPSILNPFVAFSNYSTPGTNSYWSFGDGDSSQLTNPIHKYITSGIYEVALNVQNIEGCNDVSYAQIIIRDEFAFYAPSAFSPDFNDINDKFSVFGYGIDPNKFALYIFDRWGEIIYQTNTLIPGKDGGMYSEPWNGKVNNNSPICMIGTYAWLVQYNDIKGAYRTIAGFVVIIR